MAHFYHVKDGVAQRYIQLTKKGVESKRYNHGQAFADGAVLGTTDLLKCLGDVGGLLQWTAGLGIQAGIKASSEAICNGLCTQFRDCEGMVTEHETADALIDNPPIDRAKEIHKELSERAANEGTVIHDSIENYMKGNALPEDPVQARACVDAMQFLKDQNITGVKYEHCFVWHGWINICTGDYVPNDGFNKRPDGEGWVTVNVGGTSDVVSDVALVDWKSVEDSGYGFRKPKAKECAQLALYRLGFGKPKARCWNAYFDRKAGGLVSTREWSENELRKGLIMVAMAARYSDIESSLEG